MEKNWWLGGHLNQDQKQTLYLGFVYGELFWSGGRCAKGSLHRIAPELGLEKEYGRRRLHQTSQVCLEG